MNQQKFISPTIFVFSKWSRKEYAIFASLGKLIKIGVLKADICQKALLKSLYDLVHFEGLHPDADEDETTGYLANSDSLQILLSPFGLSMLQIQNLISVATNKKGEPFKNNIIQKNIKSVFYSSVKNRLFL